MNGFGHGWPSTRMGPMLLTKESADRTAREPDPALRPDNPYELTRNGLGVRREDEAEGRRDDVEARNVVGQPLGVAEVERDRQPLPLPPRPGPPGGPCSGGTPA